MIIGAYFNQSHGGSACQGRNTFLSDMSEKKKGCHIIRTKERVT